MANGSKIIIENTAKRPHGLAPGVVLIPGNNEVPLDLWQRLKSSHRIIKAHIAAGELVEGRELPPTGLAGLKVPEAVALVRGTLNTSQLGKWAADEKRPQVLDAIKAQRAKIDAARKVADEGEGGEGEGGEGDDDDGADD